MLTLPEQLYLLAIRNRAGKLHYAASGRLQYGLAGAILMELVLRQAILLGEKAELTLSFENSNNLIKDTLLKESLSIIQKLRKPTMRKVIYKLASWRGLYQNVREELAQKKILVLERKSFLLIPYKTYPLIDEKEQAILQESMRSFILEGITTKGKNELYDETLERKIILASLIHACQLMEAIFPKELYSRAERKEIQNHLKKIAEGKIYAEMVNKVIQEVQAAMIVAVSTAAVVSNQTSGK